MFNKIILLLIIHLHLLIVVPINLKENHVHFDLKHSLLSELFHNHTSQSLIHTTLINKISTHKTLINKIMIHKTIVNKILICKTLINKILINKLHKIYSVHSILIMNRYTHPLLLIVIIIILQKNVPNPMTGIPMIMVDFVRNVLVRIKVVLTIVYKIIMQTRVIIIKQQQLQAIHGILIIILHQLKIIIANHLYNRHLGNIQLNHLTVNHNIQILLQLI